MISQDLKPKGVGFSTKDSKQKYSAEKTNQEYILYKN